MVTGHSSSWRDLDFYFLSVFQLHQKYVIAAWRFSLSQPWLLRCSPEIVQREFQRRAVREAVAGAVVRIDPLIVVGLDARAEITVEEIAFHLSGRRHDRLPDATVSPGGNHSNDHTVERSRRRLRSHVSRRFSERPEIKVERVRILCCPGPHGALLL
jgi:hypothetical protein